MPKQNARHGGEAAGRARVGSCASAGHASVARRWHARSHRADPNGAGRRPWGTGRASATITDRPGQLAAELTVRFEHDTELATRLNDAQRRLQRAIARLWWGLHRGGMVTLCEHASGVDVRFADDSFGVRGAPVPLRAARQVHRTVGRPFVGYQQAAEDRRQRPPVVTTARGAIGP